MAENQGWVKSAFFSEAIGELPPAGRVYLPTSSYAEMGQWSLPADGFGDYEELENKLKADEQWDRFSYLVRGGFWRNFMSKYHEANNMHKKMIYLTSAIGKAAEDKTIDENVLQKATDLKWQGQCNCPYWHGVFGGLYLNHLRHATYSRFIKAESLLESDREKDFLEYEVLDFDFDGQEEAILKNRQLNLYISPAYGGSIFELDYKPSNINLLDTMTRRKEGYHDKVAVADDAEAVSGGSIHDRLVAREQGLEKYLVYDWHRRLSLLDHFMNSDTEIEKFARNEYAERGNFINQPYKSEIHVRRNRLEMVMRRDGRVWINNIWASIHVEKTINLYPDRAFFDVAYEIENRSDSELEALFGIETAWSLLAGNSPDRFYHVDGKKPGDPTMLSMGVISKSDTIALTDKAIGYDIRLNSDQELDWWRFPIETISLSESGFERNYQQSTVVPVKNLQLSRGQVFELKLTFEINKL